MSKHHRTTELSYRKKDFKLVANTHCSKLCDLLVLLLDVTVGMKQGMSPILYKPNPTGPRVSQWGEEMVRVRDTQDRLGGQSRLGLGVTRRRTIRGPN